RIAARQQQRHQQKQGKQLARHPAWQQQPEQGQRRQRQRENRGRRQRHLRQRQTRRDLQQPPEPAHQHIGGQQQPGGRQSQQQQANGGQGQRQDQERQQRHRDQIQRQRQQRCLAEEGHTQRQQAQAQHPLRQPRFARPASQACPMTRGSRCIARQRPQQPGDAGEAEPETGTEDGQRVEQQDHQQRQRQTLRDAAVTTQQARQ